MNVYHIGSMEEVAIRDLVRLVVEGIGRTVAWYLANPRPEGENSLL